MELIKNCKDCSSKIKIIEETVNLGVCRRCNAFTVAYNRYFEANVPVDYWDLKISESQEDSNFHGPKELHKFYINVVSDLNKCYIDGTSFCLAGPFGIGKTLVTSNILKKALNRNFTALYTNLNDVISIMTSAPQEDKFFARKELLEKDFLVIDEFDSRYMPNETVADLFGRNLEHILRTRIQNKMPIMLVSNSPKPLHSFSETIKKGLESLMAKMTFVPVFGNDFRKIQAQK